MHASPLNTLQTEWLQPAYLEEPKTWAPCGLRMHPGKILGTHVTMGKQITAVGEENETAADTT